MTPVTAVVKGLARSVAELLGFTFRSLTNGLMWGFTGL